MIGVLIAIVLAAVVYWLCMALGLPAIVALIAAILVLLAGIPSGGYGLGSRWGARRGTF
jgi:high-affinity Fe2+/Pb2+ permease